MYMCRRGTARLVLRPWRNWQSGYKKRVWCQHHLLGTIHNAMGNSICNMSPRHLKLSLSMAIVDAVFLSILANISSPSTRLLSNQWSRQNIWGLNKDILFYLHIVHYFIKCVAFAWLISPIDSCYAIMLIHLAKITLSTCLLANLLLVNATICNWG